MELRRMMKSASAKSLIVKVNLIFLALFLIPYAIFPFLYRSSSNYSKHAASLIVCSFTECHHKRETGIKMKSIVEEVKTVSINGREPDFLSRIVKRGMRIGTVNMEGEDMSEWNSYQHIFPLAFERVSEFLQWKDVFPEWIDEEEEFSGPSCPEIPMPNWEDYGDMDILVAKLPCRRDDEQGWKRDVFRLQVHLVAANAAVRKGKWDRKWRMKMMFLSQCEPMIEFFRCDDLVAREGEWWFYTAEMGRLKQKVEMPVGSCNLALPLWEKGINKVYDTSKLRTMAENSDEGEAYATVLHSSESYVCGAITLAQSLLSTKTRRHLILLLDNSISEPKRLALSQAGWSLRTIKRIRNPRAEKGTYNEYNYSKLRLWQLTHYRKIIFIDSDIVILRNIDFLFQFPQMSAAGNDGSIFNSGVMVIEPSNCTFRMLMRRRKEIISYNGGDQGFLNENFVWWHRLPRRINFLKNFWSNYSVEANFKNQLFRSDPPKLYAIHYLGLKPWLCYRDYDCNWNLPDQRVYASDDAHSRWWRVHDAMDYNLRQMCRLTTNRKNELQWERKLAREMAFDERRHWSINITDSRKLN